MMMNTTKSKEKSSYYSRPDGDNDGELDEYGQVRERMKFKKVSMKKERSFDDDDELIHKHKEKFGKKIYFDDDDDEHYGKNYKKVIIKKDYKKFDDDDEEIFHKKPCGCKRCHGKK